MSASSRIPFTAGGIFFSAPSIVEQVRGHVMSVSGSHDLVHWTTREDSVLYYFDLSRTKPEVRTVKLPGNDTVARKVVYAAQTMDYGNHYFLKFQGNHNSLRPWTFVRGFKFRCGRQYIRRTLALCCINTLGHALIVAP